MTTDFGCTSPPSWQSQSPCLAPRMKVCCWQRCVKRKSNDGSGLQVKGFTMPKTEGGNQNTWCTMPQISHCNRSTDVLQNEKLATSSQSCLQSGDLLHKPCSEAASDNLRTYYCPSESQFVQSQHVQGAGQGLASKKRVHVAMSEELVCGSEHSCDKASRNQILGLREALKTEKKAIRKLYRDLEEERCASAAAANEAIAMIRRLQDQKSAALVESRHYRLASEERETYNLEAIALLKEALSVMENEVRSLQEHVETYRGMLLKAKSGQGNQLEENENEEQLFLLEGDKMTPCSLVDSNEFLYQSQIRIVDVTKEEALDDVVKWHHHPSKVTSLQGHDFEDTYCDGYKSELEANDVMGARDLDDVSMSILARVARLEERISCLNHSQACDLDCSNSVSHDMTRNLGESEAMRSVEQHSSSVISCSSARSREGYVADNRQDVEDLKWTDFGKVTINLEHRKHEGGFSAHIEGPVSEPFEIKPRGYTRGLSKDIGHESTFQDTGDAEPEGIHDLYEVRCDPNSCAMPSVSESFNSRAGSTDVIIDSTFENKLSEGRASIFAKGTTPLDDLEGCNAPTDGKLSTEANLVDGETSKSSVSTEDVHNLKIRLQALEGERAFMKVAIDSLRKENMELKLLQDIAQQLRELKGDVWKTGVKGPRRHEHFPFFSFIKGILSFAGFQSRATTEKRRFFHPCQESSESGRKEQGQTGLFHLLNNPSKEERLMRVIRECKVKLGSA